MNKLKISILHSKAIDFISSLTGFEKELYRIYSINSLNKKTLEKLLKTDVIVIEQDLWFKNHWLHDFIQSSKLPIIFLVDKYLETPINKLQTISNPVEILFQPCNSRQFKFYIHKLIKNTPKSEGFCIDFKLFKRVFDQIDDSLLVINSDYKVVYNNTYKAKNNQYCYKILKKRNLPCKICPLQKVFIDGQIRELQHDNWPDKRTRKINFIPFKGQSGEVQYVIEHIKDVTELVTIQEKYKKENQRLKQAMEIGNMAWWEWDVKNERVEFDSRKALMLGFQYNELKPKLKNIFDLIHPGDYKSAVRIMNKCLKEKEKFYEIEYRLKTKNGHWKWFYDKGEVINRDESGKPTRLMGVIVDIMERRNAIEAYRLSEHRFKKYIELSPLGIHILSEDGRFVFANQAFCNILEIEKKELGNIHFKDFHFKEDLPKQFERFQNLKKKGNIHYEISLLTAKKTKIDVVIYATKLDDGQFLAYCQDITSRKRAEKDLENYKNHLERLVEKRTKDYEMLNNELLKVNMKLTNNRNFLNAIIENLPIGLQVFDKKGFSVQMNQAHAKNIGVKNTQVGIGEFNVLTDPLAIENGSSERFQQAYQGQTIINHEFAIDFGGKSNKWDTHKKKTYFTQTIFPVFTSQNEVEAVVALTWDITQRKLYEQKLRNANLIVESSPAVLFRWKADKDWTIDYVSSNVDQIGFTEKQIIEEVKKYTQIIHPDDLIELRKYINEKINKKNDLISSEYRIITSSGIVRWVQEQSRVIKNQHNKPIYFEGIVMDISHRKSIELALKESENIFRSFVEQSPMGIMLTNEKGLVTEWNTSAEEISGFKAEEILYKNMWDIHKKYIKSQKISESEQMLQNTFKYLLKPDDTATVTKPIEEQIQRKDKSKIYVRNTVFPVKTQKGYLAATIMLDITQQKKAEKDILKALKKEKELNKMKSSFVSMTSHQFKTPLTTILSSSELLNYYIDKIPKDLQLSIRKHIKRISIQVNHMDMMINDFLLLGKVETGKIPFNPIPFNIKYLIQEVIENHFYSEKSRNRILIDIKADNCLIKGDAKLFQHIISNLISNSLKYSEKEIKLFISLNNASFVLNIKDQGIGIPDADKEKLFTSFFRAGNTSDYHGTGLGLTIVKRFVEMHQGKIHVKSQLNKGTEFIIEIPQ